MQINFLKTIVEDIAGKPATEIVDLLVGKKDVNEFLIAKKLGLTINQTRNILYKLFDEGLISFTRKKDKRKGWYIYFWTLDSLKSLEFLENKLLEEIMQFRHQLENRKVRRFYFCKICNVEVGEETALLNDFTCQECGQVYALAKNDKAVKELENKISKLEKQLKIIGEERGKLSKKENKKIKRKIEKEKKEKLREKAKKKADRKKEAKKPVKKKSEKKKIKRVTKKSKKGKKK